MENEPLLDISLKSELSQLYRADGRHYHTLTHIEALLAMMQANRALFHDPEAVEAAIWFHDAIYDSRKNDNEALSAGLARERLGGRTSGDRLERIARMIEATATHTPPRFTDEAAELDALLFLDMDLSILGASPTEFDAYEVAIRREYDWVDDASWRRGRADLLKRFAGRPRIFRTAAFRQRFEKMARSNIARSLAHLAAKA